MNLLASIPDGLDTKQLLYARSSDALRRSSSGTIFRLCQAKSWEISKQSKCIPSMRS